MVFYLLYLISGKLYFAEELEWLYITTATVLTTY